MRALRNVIDISLPFVGVGVIVGAMVTMRESLWSQVALVGLGVLLIQLGIWKTAHQLMPNGRQYLTLRAEVDQFVGFIRELNTAALAVREDDSPQNRLAFEIVQGRMRQAVARMAAVAGKTDAEIAAERKISAKTDASGQTEPSESPEQTVTIP